jgi:hypothetical protein
MLAPLPAASAPGRTPVPSRFYLPLVEFEADCRCGGHLQVFESRLYRFWKRFQYLGYILLKHLIKQHLYA